MKKWVILLMLGMMLGLPAGGAWAGTIIDIGPRYPSQTTPLVPGYTAVEAWAAGQTPGNGYNGSGVFYDVLGNYFATDKMVISAAGVFPITIQIWTNNQPGGWNVLNQNWGVADIAYNYKPATAAYDNYTLQHFPGAVSRFERGINMQAYAAGTPGQNGGGVNNVFIAQVNTWSTSFAAANPVAGATYGGAYKLDSAPAGSEQAPVETVMLQYNPHFWGNMSWVVNDPQVLVNPNTSINNNVPDYLITITFPNFSWTGEWEYLWATAKCGNDVVHVIPIPGSLLLAGTGLLGMVALAWRKKA